MLQSMRESVITQLSLHWDETLFVLENLFSLGFISIICVLLLKQIEKMFFKDERSGNWRLVHRDRIFFKREFVRELGWPLLNPLILWPLLGAQQYLIIEVLLRPICPEQPFDHIIQSWPMWAQVLAGVFVLDLTLYLRHRFVHHFFWPYHTVHHAAREITWLTLFRLHPFDTLFMRTIALMVLFVLGFSGEGIVFAAGVQMHFNRFVHSNIQLDYGFPLRYIFVSPNMHRWHHAADDPQAYNKNFAIVFAFFDVLFGTFYVPKDRLPARYGVIDEQERDVVGEGFMEQMAYPFVHHWRWVRQRLPRRKVPTTPKEGASP